MRPLVSAGRLRNSYVLAGGANGLLHFPVIRTNPARINRMITVRMLDMDG